MKAHAREPVPVTSLADHYFLRPEFKLIFDQGMKLAEDSAQYFHGPSRDEELENLSENLRPLFDKEEKLLVRRVMQLIPWLLKMKTISEQEGDYTARDAGRREMPLKLDGLEVEEKDLLKLPPKLVKLIRRSFAVMDEIKPIHRRYCTSPLQR